MCVRELLRALAAGILACALVPAFAQQPAPPSCSFAGAVPAGATLYHVGSYGGNAGVGAAVELDDTGHDVKKLDVVVNLPGQSIVLVLTAYDPVVWNVAWSPGSRVVAAVVSGNHGQAIVGIPSSIPLYLATNAGQREKRERGQCPAFYAYKRDHEYPRAEEAIRRITGLPVSRFIEAPRNGPVLVGDAMPASLSKLESSPDFRLEDFLVARKAREVPAGARGFEELARQGLVRHATPQDVARFQAAGARGIMGGIPTYVLLGPVTLPGGLYGAHSVNILVPAGVPMPRGNAGHSRVFREDDGKGR